ncbi:MAG: AMP-binding protein, partial [Clostridia bacterium]|nr:AMP-binding protein [Clostridia bacterium]
PDHQYDTNYGLSESIGPGAVHLGVENVHKVGAIGIPGHGWQVRIVDSEGKDVPQGEVGELLLKGDGVMVCYYNDPEATAASLKDGWLYTGDMAMTDEEGFIFLVDRKKDVIISGGENLYPVEIENFMAAHQKIGDVAVIGLPDERLGEIAAAIIQIKPGMDCTEEEIQEFCLGMPRYKRPRKIIFAEVPRNPTGKIEKPKLRKIYGSEQLVASQNKS